MGRGSLWCDKRKALLVAEDAVRSVKDFAVEEQRVAARSKSTTNAVACQGGQATATSRARAEPAIGMRPPPSLPPPTSPIRSQDGVPIESKRENVYSFTGRQEAKQKTMKEMVRQTHTSEYPLHLPALAMSAPAPQNHPPSRGPGIHLMCADL